MLGGDVDRKFFNALASGPVVLRVMRVTTGLESMLAKTDKRILENFAVLAE